MILPILGIVLPIAVGVAVFRFAFRLARGAFRFILYGVEGILGLIILFSIIALI